MKEYQCQDEDQSIIKGLKMLIKAWKDQGMNSEMKALIHKSDPEALNSTSKGLIESLATKIATCNLSASKEYPDQISVSNIKAKDC